LFQRRERWHGDRVDEKVLFVWAAMYLRASYSVSKVSSTSSRGA